MITGYRAKKRGLDIATELQYEDSNNPDVAMMLAQSGSSSQFVFPYAFREFEARINEAEADPYKQYLLIERYRFYHYQELAIEHQCSLQGVIAYMLCLWIVEEYFSLDEGRGIKELEEIVEKKHES